MFVVALRQNEKLSPAQKQILDERLAERKSNHFFDPVHLRKGNDLFSILCSKEI